MTRLPGLRKQGEEAAAQALGAEGKWGSHAGEQPGCSGRSVWGLEKGFWCSELCTHKALDSVK